MRRANHPRYHSNYGSFRFRHFPGSNKPFAFTQQYGRSLLSISYSVLRLRSDRLYGMSCYCLAPADNSLETLPSNPLHHSRFVIFKFVINYNTLCRSCQDFFTIFLFFQKNHAKGEKATDLSFKNPNAEKIRPFAARRHCHRILHFTIASVTFVNTSSPF